LNAEKIYIWTDEKGIEHITNTPPPKNVKPKETINLIKKRDQKDKYNTEDISKLKRELDRKKKCYELFEEAKLLADLQIMLLQKRRDNFLKVIEYGERNPPSYLLEEEKSLKRLSKDTSFKQKVVDLRINELRCEEQ
jgi:hypothetical protein